MNDRVGRVYRDVMSICKCGIYFDKTITDYLLITYVYELRKSVWCIGHSIAIVNIWIVITDDDDDYVS